MEKNCLVTKLKKSLDNNDLERLGMIKLKIRPVPNDSTVGGINWAYLNKAYIHYDDYTGGFKVKDTIGNVLNDGNEFKGLIIADSSDECILFIPKYKLYYLEMNCLTEFTYINDSVPLAIFKVVRNSTYLEQYPTIDLSLLLPVKSTLKHLEVSRCKVYCPSDILRQFTNLTELVITETSFTTPINITDLDLMTSLTRMMFNGSKSIMGRLENFAAAQWSTYNRKSGTISITGSDSYVTLNNTSVSDNCSIVYSENNIIITDGNRTATFDGTEWRYS